MQNSARRLPTFGPTKPRDLSHWPTCGRLWNYIHHLHLLLLSSKADTYFTIHTAAESTYRWLVTDGFPAREHAVTYLSDHRAQCRLITLIEANALTTTLGHGSNQVKRTIELSENDNTVTAPELQMLRWKSWEGTAEKESLWATSKTDIEGADMTCWGSLFQVWAAATGEAPRWTARIQCNNFLRRSTWHAAALSR